MGGNLELSVLSNAVEMCDKDLAKVVFLFVRSGKTGFNL